MIVMLFSAYEDRQKNTSSDGYNTQQYLDAHHHLLTENKKESIRDRAILAIMHNGLLRGDESRSIQLCDLMLQ